MQITKTQKIVLQILTLMVILGMGIHEIILLIPDPMAMFGLMVALMLVGLWQAQILVEFINEK